jgi:hypothetical protein
VKSQKERVSAVLTSKVKHQSTHNPPANPKDVESIDAIVTAAYDEISGPPGKQRNWDRERSLFLPGARLIPTAKPGEDGDLAPQMLDVEGFIARAEPILKNGFFEKEIARQTQQFGQLAHVWSTYESRRSEDEPEPFMRGINSIQLFHDGARWWIVSIFWQHESKHAPIPDKYLKDSEHELSCSSNESS